MTSKLVDCVVQAHAFDTQTMPKDATDEQVSRHIKFKNNIVHIASLLHAVALATLRDDYDMENITVRAQAHTAQPPRPGCAGGLWWNGSSCLANLCIAASVLQ